MSKVGVIEQMLADGEVTLDELLAWIADPTEETP